MAEYIGTGDAENKYGFPSDAGSNSLRSPTIRSMPSSLVLSANAIGDKLVIIRRATKMTALLEE